MLERDARWAWLFPITYAVHIAEEYAADFPGWLAGVAGARLTEHDFLVINAIAFAVMTVGVAAATALRVQWPLAALATVVTINAVVHIGGSIMTASYSPGLVTATTLWLPLGIYAFRTRLIDLSTPQYASGVAAGIVAHAIVSMLALFG